MITIKITDRNGDTIFPTYGRVDSDKKQQEDEYIMISSLLYKLQRNNNFGFERWYETETG